MLTLHRLHRYVNLELIISPFIMFAQPEVVSHETV